MTNAKLRIIGSITLDVLISKGNGRVIKVRGNATSKNVKDNYNQMYNNALQDAIAQHQYKYEGRVVDSGTLKRQLGNRTYRYEVVNVRLSYESAKRFYRIKRKNINGRYYTEARDRRTGQLKSRVRWSSKLS